MNQMQEQTEAGKQTMRALIHDGGIGKAVATVADMYAAPANYDERDRLAGMILAAYEAGQLNALQVHKETMESF